MPSQVRTLRVYWKALGENIGTGQALCALDPAEGWPRHLMLMLRASRGATRGLQEGEGVPEQGP